MGIAWFDDDPPPMEEPTLRIGGIPLLSPELKWPSCSRCGLPMLFRAQVPLALTSLVSPFDNRLLLFFECHAKLLRTPCDGGALLITNGVVSPRMAPKCHNFDVLLFDYGEQVQQVKAVVNSLQEGVVERESERSTSLYAKKSSASKRLISKPKTVLSNVPPSIGSQAVHMLSELGATVELLPVSPTTLPHVRGGKLVPFDDGSPGTRNTTLPPISKIQADFGLQTMRGLIGGATPGYRDYSYNCNCGRQTRTAVRLLADTSPRVITLGPAVAQICLHCNSGSLHRHA
ncbi:MAG: hypothetical protein JXA30_18830 [Deltaproteobacteria bacterium]|nr:hypothetical protein [Deltaproteobacteria bacterium]